VPGGRAALHGSARRSSAREPLAAEHGEAQARLLAAIYEGALRLRQALDALEAAHALRPLVEHEARLPEEK
jgi:hypothetical protein